MCGFPTSGKSYWLQDRAADVPMGPVHTNAWLVVMSVVSFEPPEPKFTRQG
jgi:hypothetical protein